MVAVLLPAALLRLYNITAVGAGNLYYTAAVQSMLGLRRNLFFLAAEPGGSVRVDRPPLGLWLQTAAARLFGLHGLPVVWPQITAGVLAPAPAPQGVHWLSGNAPPGLARLELRLYDGADGGARCLDCRGG